MTIESADCSTESRANCRSIPQKQENLHCRQGAVQEFKVLALVPMAFMNITLNLSVSSINFVQLV